MEIVIGREEGARRLHCVVDGREFNIGQAGSVPLSVSRKHCKLVVEGGRITIQNINIQNVTYVDNTQVFCKDISSSSKIQLGKERYSIPLQQILSLATGAPQAPTPQQPTYSLLPLKRVWDEYDRNKMAIQEDAAKKANRQRLQGIISLFGMCIGFIPGIDPAFRFMIIILALVVAIYFFIKGQTDQTVQAQIHDLDEKFARKYKCPNPKCGRPFGPIPYRQIEFTPRCMACGCTYTH